MVKTILIKDVADDFAICPRVMADYEGENGLPAHKSEMRTITEIISDSQNQFHKLLMKFHGATLGELLEYLNKSGIPYVTNEVTIDFSDYIHD